MTDLPPTATVPPSRRAVVRTALWSVPAITLATAAPAFADSGELTLAFNAGQTAANDAGWLYFNNATVVVSGAATTSAQLRMMVTFEPIRAGDPVSLGNFDTPSGWELEAGDGEDTLTYLYSLSVRTGDQVPVDGGPVVHWYSPDFGTYHVFFEVSGYTSRPTASFPLGLR